MATFARGQVQGGSFSGEHPGFSSVLRTSESEYVFQTDSALPERPIFQLTSVFPEVTFACLQTGSNQISVQTRKLGKAAAIGGFSFFVLSR